MAIFVLTPGFAGEVQAQVDDLQISREYFVQQEANEALLIRLDAFEAEIQSRVYGPERTLLLTSGIPGNRIAPLFQLIESVDVAQQLDIEVSSALNTARSNYNVEISRLPVWDSRSASLARAYRSLSFGMQAPEIQNAPNWTVQINSLMTASRIFKQLGMRELRLWADYYTAYFIYTHLHDYNLVLGMSRDILAELKNSQFEQIELATLQLQSAVMISLRVSGALSGRVSEQDPIQDALFQVAALAQSLDYQFELAHALNASGVEYAKQSRNAQALEQFQRALDITVSLADGDLATIIRESIVQIHTRLGNAPATSKVLQEIETHLAEEGASDELALNLLQQAKLFIRNYQYQRAIKVLAQALESENDSALRRQLNFTLAQALYEDGQAAQSLARLQVAGIDPGAVRPGRTDTAIEMDKGLQMMAGIYRHSGHYTDMQRARSAQLRELKTDAGKAVYFYEKGLDEITQYPNEKSRARASFRQSYRSASRSSSLQLKQLSLLQLCALAEPDKVLCSKTSNLAAYDSLIARTIPRLATEAMYLRAQYLVLQGQRSAAAEMLDHLVGEIHFYRQMLPGVLGAWYWQRHEFVFAYYADLVTRGTESASRFRQGKPVDGFASLLALSKIRFAQRPPRPEPFSDHGSVSSEPLRELLAQLQARTSSAAPDDPGSRARHAIQGIREPFDKEFKYLSKTGVQMNLDSFTKDEALLTYHITATGAFVWVGFRGRVQLRMLPEPGVLYSSLYEIRKNLPLMSGARFDFSMDRLGRQLLAPVIKQLPSRVYWIPSGVLMGFPLDAARINGRYMIEQHEFVNLMSFPLRPGPTARLHYNPPLQVFLGGYPQDYSGGYASRLETSSEIQAVADIFLGPGLHIIQGAALLPDEFLADWFQQANLAHLSMPGIIDLESPLQSKLELSEDRNRLGRASLGPADIPVDSINAGLIFLSSTRITGHVPSATQNTAGLISDFLNAGALAVIANLWGADGRHTESMVTGFYNELKTTGNIATALTNSKRRQLQNISHDDLHDWAGFQVYIE